MNFSRPRSFVIGGLIATALLAAAPIASAALLMVDFNNLNASVTSPTQSGFSSAVIGQDTSTALVFNFGPHTVRTLDLTPDGNASLTQSGSRDRGALGGAATAVSDLYRDFIFANTSNTRRFGLVIEGLQANTTYDLTFWAYDRNASATQTVTVSQFGNPAVTGAVSYLGSALPTSLSDYSTRLLATANASGVLQFEVTGTDNAILNGFSFDVVPEPGTVLLMLGAAGFAVLRRHRR